VSNDEDRGTLNGKIGGEKESCIRGNAGEEKELQTLKGGRVQTRSAKKGHHGKTNHKITGKKPGALRKENGAARDVRRKDQTQAGESPWGG